MTDTTKSPAPAAAPADPAAAPAATEKTALKLGDKVRLRAVHGYMQHPFNLVEFETDSEPKVEVDFWHLAQVEAGKLAVVE